jgi:hypothetical protein
MVQGFQTNYLNDMTCLNRQTNDQTNSQTSRQTNVKPVVKRAVKPAVTPKVKPKVKPVCLQATHTAQCHNELLNNDGFKIPPAKLNVHNPRTECTINATKKNAEKRNPRYVCQSNRRNKKTERSNPPSPLPKRKRKENRDPQLAMGVGTGSPIIMGTHGEFWRKHETTQATV